MPQALPRADVVKCAQRAIRVTRRQRSIETKLVRELMKIARQAPEFALGAWYVDHRCGCLIGNLHGARVETIDLTDTEYWIGMNFDDELHAALDMTPGMPRKEDVVKVIDD